MLYSRPILSFLLFSILQLFFTVSLIAQETDVLMTNTRGVEEDRYKGIKGSPYIYSEWQTGKIISVDADVIEGVPLNFNGETNGFEIKKGNRYIELDPQWYIRVIIDGKTPEEDVVFQKNFLPPLKNKFTRQVFKGKDITIVEDFTAKIETTTINNVGKNEVIKKFYSKTKYYLIKDRKPTLFKLKKKVLLPLLGHEKELEQFLKKEKIKLNKEKDLIRLLTFYEESGF